MSQRPITGYFLSPLSGGENHEITTPTDEPQLSEPLSSTLGDQSGESSVTDIAPARDRPVNEDFTGIDSAYRPDPTIGSGLTPDNKGTRFLCLVLTNHSPRKLEARG